MVIIRKKNWLWKRILIIFWTFDRIIMVFVLFSGSINFPNFVPLVMFTCQRVCVSKREVSIYIVLSVRYWSSNLLGQYFGSTFVHDGSSSQISALQYIDPYELLEDERISQIAPRVKWSASLSRNLQTPNTGFGQLVSCLLFILSLYKSQTYK